MTTVVEVKYEYKWKHTAPAKVKPDIAAKELVRIKDVHGRITPELIVNEAKKKSNPLHDCFEWNDTVAAAKYREDQARYILRQIKVTITKGDDEPIRIRAFHSVMENNERIYTTVQHARQDPELWEQVQAKALLEIKNWRETYEHIKAFEAIFGVIDDFE